jgi:ADP-heptose:LPS heptosyltransferase
MQQREDTALVGSLLLYPNGKVQHAGKISASEHVLHGQDLVAEAFIDREIMGVTGALLGINRRFLDQVQKLDESYHMAWEDADLCLTAHTLGWKVFYCGRACAYHDEGGTRGGTPSQKKEYSEWMTWETKGREVFENKWGTDYARKKWGVKPKRPFLNRLILKRTTALGDVLLTTPIVHALREKKPDWEIIVATNHPFIYRDNPDVNYVIPVNHDWVVSKDCEAFYELDLAYEMCPDVGILKAYTDACNVNVKDPWPRVYLRDHNRLFASNILSDSSKWVVIHPGPKGWPGGDWPWERFSEVSETLQNKGFKVVLVGNTPPDPIKCDLDLRHKTTFHNLAAVVERSSLFVGIDSMPMHLAQAFRKPCVGIFGCVDPSHILVSTSFVRGVTASQNKVPCLGCHHRGDFPKTRSVCDKDKVYCMEELSANEVIRAIDSIRQE